MTIIYLHGFASVGTGLKSAALIKEFGAGNIIAPDLPLDPDEVESLIDQKVRGSNNYPIIFIGTSLGGFWANYFAQKWDAYCVIVNPVTHPSKLLREKIGQANHNFVTGEFVEVTEDVVNKYTKREVYLKENTNGALINLFLAKDDPVLNYQEILKAMPYFASCVIKEDGGHRFEAHWAEVVVRLRDLLSKD